MFTVCNEGFRGSPTDSSAAGAVGEELPARPTFLGISPTRSKRELPAANAGR